jgi:hypothetical protein
MVGRFGDPHRKGSMATFTTREAAEEFVSGDPFALNGVVSGWESASETTCSPEVCRPGDGTGPRCRPDHVIRCRERGNSERTPWPTKL